MFSKNIKKEKSLKEPKKSKKNKKQEIENKPTFEIVGDDQTSSNNKEEDHGNFTSKLISNSSKEIELLLNGSLTEIFEDENEKERKLLKKDGFVYLDGDNVNNDFVILDDNDPLFKRLLKGFLKSFKFIVIIALIFLISGIGFFLCLFKIVPGKISGCNYYNESKNISLVSNNYSPNLDEIRKGWTVYVNKNSNILPYVSNCETYTFIKQEGIFLYCEDKKGNNIKINQSEVDYISSNSISTEE